MNKPKYKELYKNEQIEKKQAVERFEHLIRILKEVGISIEDKKEQSTYSFETIRYISIENNGKKVYITYAED